MSTAVSQDWTTASLAELTNHITETHHTFLRTHLPKIRTRLEKILGKAPDKICGFIPNLAQTFFALQEELDAHLLKEERILFPYIAELEAAATENRPPKQMHCGSVLGPIRQMEQEHTNALKALDKLRTLTGGYPIVEDMCNNRRGLFEDLMALDSDLRQHIHLENDVLHPRALESEKRQST